MACAQFYTISRGDTLSSIAAQFETTAENILRLNPSLNPQNLIPGTRICVISATEQPVVCPIGSLPYNINQGDTLQSIAARFNTTVQSLLLSNPDINPTNLIVGQRICISEGIRDLPPCDSQNFYVIRRGDTLRSIASVFEINVSDIVQINPGINPRNLTVGQVICLPASPSPIEIVVNISAKTLTVYRNGSIFREFLVATGKPSTPTPVGSFTVVNKQIDPGGPYGTRWLGLSERGYGIHGTNDPSSIGTAASNGCIRMYNEDIEALFSITNVGTPVRILP